jgi:hypothetical protein
VRLVGMETNESEVVVWFDDGSIAPGESDV